MPPSLPLLTKTSTEREARLLLWLHPHIGPVRYRRLLDSFGSAAGAWSAGETAWAALSGGGWNAEKSHRVLASLPDLLAREEKRVAAWGARLITDLDPEYPALFRELYDPPVAFCLWGALPEGNRLCVALVGSRSASPYGTAMAERLGRELTEAHVPVVSGLARGIDTAAHRAVLAGGGQTLGVLGGGLDHFYPAENRRLAEAMTQRGAVLTEFPMDARPEPHHFPRRNRLIAALSAAVVVVEAQEKSGALITASLALELGKDVGAVPGSVFSPGSRGPHRLLKQGATPVESAADVLEMLALPSPAAPAPRVESRETAPSQEGSPLMAHLGVDPVGVDFLAEKTGMSAAQISAALLSLELSGRVRACPGNQFALTERALPALRKGTNRG